MNTQTSRRILTGAKVASWLGKAIIPALGTNKLSITGPGNPYTREDGTAIHIFNVAAFATHDKAKAASEAWKEGLTLEKSGDVDGAQLKFREAMNNQMSFSVLAENAADYQSAYEINCLVEEITNSKGEMVIGINRPRPVAVSTNGTSAAALFSVPAEGPKTETAAEKKARLKAEKAAKAA